MNTLWIVYLNYLSGGLSFFFLKRKKDRGVKKILFLVSDGVSGITEASKEAFPGVFHQICVVHLVRNLKKYANKTLSKEVVKGFKKVYSAPNKEIALLNRDEFNEKYKNKNTIINMQISILI